jgi:FixJ family two-component response regulator
MTLPRMIEPQSIVNVVDDDLSFLRSVRRLLRGAGFNVVTFTSAEEFLDTPRSDVPMCLVLDVRLKGSSGLDLQRRMTRNGYPIPIIFTTGHGDIPMSVQAMKAGALEFLTKPFSAKALINAVNSGLEKAVSLRETGRQLVHVRERYGSLTQREREVLALVVAGKLNKQIAGDLGTSEKTIKFHRANVMRKMQVQSVAELVRSATLLGLSI